MGSDEAGVRPELLLSPGPGVGEDVSHCRGRGVGSVVTRHRLPCPGAASPPWSPRPVGMALWG